MYSMTGFGRAEKKSRLGKLTLELSSVNNRFLEFSFRLPRPCMQLEPRFRELIGSALGRGKVTVSLSIDVTEGSQPPSVVNERWLALYVRQIRSLQRSLGLEAELSIGDLLLLPEVLQPDRLETDADVLWREIEPVARRALQALVAMRRREGQALRTDMLARLKGIARQVRRVQQRSRHAVRHYAERLRRRIDELLAPGGPVDELRLEQEVAFFAERTDISEECVRLKSHLEQFRRTLRQRGPVGRRLNFLLQEMNREVNTIGSKSADFDIATEVIAMKEEIEKLREQVQNVE